MSKDPAADPTLTASTSHLDDPTLATSTSHLDDPTLATSTSHLDDPTLATSTSHLDDPDVDDGENFHNFSNYDDGLFGLFKRVGTIDLNGESVIAQSLSRRETSTSLDLDIMPPHCIRSSSLSATALPKDYLKLQLREHQLVVDIKLSLLGTSYIVERKYLDGLLAAYNATELDRGYLQRLSSLGSREARDQFFAQTYLRTVVEPAYFKLPLKLKEQFRDRVEELQRQVTEGSRGPVVTTAVPCDNSDADGFRDMTAAEAEAAVGNDDPDSPNITKRNSKATMGSERTRSRLARQKSGAGYDPAPTQYTTDSKKEKDVAVPVPGSSPDFEIPSAPPAPRSRTRSDASDDASLYDLPARRQSKRRHVDEQLSLADKPIPTIPQPLLRTTTGLDGYDPYQFTAPKQEPTWKEIAEGKWPPPPAGVAGSEAQHSNRRSLLPLEIEQQQTDLPLPPPVTTLLDENGVQVRQGRRLTWKPLEEIYASDTAMTDESLYPSLKLNRAKFSWELSPGSSVIGERDVEGELMEIAHGTYDDLDSDVDDIPSARVLEAMGGLHSDNDDSEIAATKYNVVPLYLRPHEPAAQGSSAAFVPGIYCAFRNWAGDTLSLAIGQRVRVLEAKSSLPVAGAVVETWFLVQTMESVAGVNELEWVPSDCLVSEDHNRLGLHSPEVVLGPTPQPRIDAEATPSGLEVLVGPRPGTPQVEQSLYDPHYSTYYAQPQDDGHTYWFDTPEPPAPIGTPLYNRLAGIFNALLPRYFSAGIMQPMLPMWKSQHIVTELEASDTAPFSLFSEQCPIKAYHIPPNPPVPAEISEIQKNIISATFGKKLCCPEYHELGYMYLIQLDKHLLRATGNARVLMPTSKNQKDRLVSLTILIAEKLDPQTSIENFVTLYSYMSAFRISPNLFDAPANTMGAVELDSTIVSTPSRQTVSNPPNQTLGGESWAPDSVLNTEQERTKAYEAILFALESYLMLPTPENLASVFTTPIELLCSRLQPLELLHEDDPSPGDTLITPIEMSASMLHEWRGISFEWTTDPSSHLSHDSQNNTIALYGHIGYAYLHSLAREDSSLAKNGFRKQHRMLAEIAATYRLLFGLDSQSHNYFLEIDVKRRKEGFFDIFASLPCADTRPRPQYNVNKDFPLYGERLLTLRSLLKPTGLGELWKDKRDSLQWYTFWAVVFLGLFGILLGLIQMALAAVQAWASLAALKKAN